MFNIIFWEKGQDVISFRGNSFIIRVVSTLTCTILLIAVTRSNNQRPDPFSEESEFIEFHVENDSYFIKLPISELRKTELTLSENGISDENSSKVVEYILIQTFDSVREESWVGVNDTERFQFHVGYFIEYEIQGWKGN